MQSPFSKVPTANGQAPATKAVTGQYLAKATVNYPPRRRADDAAGWLRGQVIIKPTIKLAAETFGVSVPLVAQARDRLEQRERSKRHGNGGTTTLSDDAIDRIVVEVGPERVMRSLDRITQPQLPLVAAE
jgi:hypothetical protein